jgi:hypothetical protein
MKNKNTTRAAARYWRRGRKNLRTIQNITPDEARAQIEAMIADLCAQASELPKLRAEKEQLEEKITEFSLKVATLAAQINPELFKENPGVAIKFALKRLRDTRRILNEIAIENESKHVAATAQVEKADLAKFSIPFQRAVRWITEEKNWDRAFPKFKKFLAAKFTKDGEAEGWLQHRRNGMLTGEEWVKLYREYTPWWKREKSRQARKSALARKRKQGRVKRPKSDLRFKENRRHKQGYCRGCGKRVRRGERLCDQCRLSRI